MCRGKKKILKEKRERERVKVRLEHIKTKVRSAIREMREPCRMVSESKILTIPHASSATYSDSVISTCIFSCTGLQ